MIIPNNTTIYADTHKLAVFTVEHPNGTRKRYEIEGNISYISSRFTYDRAIHVSNLTMLVDGQEMTEIGHTWDGNTYTAEDCLLEFLASMTRQDGLCKKESVTGMLALFIDDFDVPLISRGKKFSRYVLSRTGEKLSLCLATDKYLYYADGNDEVSLMLRTDTHEVVSDNHFASDGFQMSLDAIREGKEVVCFKVPTKK